MKPEKVFRVGSVSASVFLNEIRTDSGQREVRNVNLQRRYRDGDGEWKTAMSLGLPDLPQAQATLDMAMKYVASMEADQTPI